MDFIKNLFKKKVTGEKATVRLSSLSKWVDLQYKTILDPVLQRIHTNEESLQGHVKDLKDALDTFNKQDFVEEKAHVHKLVDDYTHRFSRDTSEFILFLEAQDFSSGLLKSHEMYNLIEEKVHKLLDSQTKYEHILFKYYKQFFKKVTDTLQKIAHNAQQFTDIIDHDSVRSYLKVKAQISFFFDKKAQKKKLNEKKKKLIQQFDEQHILFDKYNKKAHSILEDPKYKIEKEQQLKPAYYDLEYKDYDSKRIQVRKKCVKLKNEIDEIHAQILNLELKGTLEQVQRQILNQINIEVEVLED